jgi:hypothetical protein
MLIFQPFLNAIQIEVRYCLLLSLATNSSRADNNCTRYNQFFFSPAYSLPIKEILLSIEFALALGEIMYNHNNKKKNCIPTITTFLLLVTTILIVASVSSTPLAAPTYLLIQSAEAFIDPSMDNVAEPRKAPTIVSGDNIYIAWWTNNTENGNEEVMFRASNDGGATFGDKINLSNSSEADSWRVEVAGEGADVVVSWWEMTQTSDIPLARVSNDGGATFGPMILLAANGTLGSGEAEEIAIAEEEGEG